MFLCSKGFNSDGFWNVGWYNNLLQIKKSPKLGILDDNLYSLGFLRQTDHRRLGTYKAYLI
jgi:hypothetical protein